MDKQDNPIHTAVRVLVAGIASLLFITGSVFGKKSSNKGSDQANLDSEWKELSVNLMCQSSCFSTFRLMKGVFLFFLCAVILLLNGCLRMVAEKVTGASSVNVHTSGLTVEFSGVAPIGKYFLKTKDGQIVAVGEVSQSNIVRNSISTYSVINIERQGWLPSEISGGCVHIERPDGKTLRIGLSQYENFTIPFWKYESLKNFDLIKAREKVADLERQKSIRQQAEKWIDNHPELYRNGMCFKLDPGPKPRNACANMDEVYELYGNYCWTSNFICPGFGGGTRFLGADDMISFALTSGCQFHLDNYNPDWYTFFRSNIITLFSTSLYERFKGGELGDVDKLNAELAAGLVNTFWCLKDKQKICEKNYKQWKEKPIINYNECNDVKSKYDVAVKLLGKNNENFIAAQKEITRIEEEISEIEKAFKPSKIPIWGLIETQLEGYKRGIFGAGMINKCD